MAPVMQEFRDAIRAAGFEPPEEIIFDGRIHRFASNGKRGDSAGWYIGHDDGIPAGIFGDWRTGSSQLWQANIGRTLTTAEQAAHRAKVETMRREREAEEGRRKAEGANKATAIWHAAQPTPENHPYLVKKGIGSHGARLHNDELVIPMLEGNDIHSLQFIGADGEKRFLFGGRVAGCYFIIGNLKGAASLCIAEGFATASTIHESTNFPVAVAFNAGNLELVTRALREKFTDLTVTVCADDDVGTEGNPGLTKATAACLAVGGKLAVPEFGTDRPDWATDFNDMGALCGREAVAAAIANAKPPPGEKTESPEWSAPKDLPGGLHPVPSMHEDMVPEPLRPWLVDITDRMQCPLEFPTIGAVVSLSSLVGRRVGIRPKRQDDWLAVPNLWGCVVGRPGILKSPALAEAMKPLLRLEMEAHESYESEIKDFELKRVVLKAQREELQDKIKKAVKDGKDPNVLIAGSTLPSEKDEEPVPLRYIVNDPTIEKLGELLNQNPKGLLLFRDELIGWLKNLEREGRQRVC